MPSLRPTHVILRIKRLTFNHWLWAHKQSPQYCNPNLAGYGYRKRLHEGRTLGHVRASMATSTLCSQTAFMITSIALRPKSSKSSPFIGPRRNHHLTTKTNSWPSLSMYPSFRIRHKEEEAFFLGKEAQAQCTTNTAHIPNLRSFSFVVDRMALFALLNGESW
jgi:hypothetical protein